ncbi:glycosyltransferase family A protein [Microvirga pakistanensis]|uniref:glycosyltransferase family A protein n=1 Tax=Microvirga pakistanensis TaxID=1682650 RepID=UPI00106982A3|nr:glycosyltransferase family A protein [Microvirga pakistanensis]
MRNPPNLSNEQNLALERAGKMMEAGDFNTASTYLEGAKVTKGRAWRMLLRCYFQTHRFEDLTSTYETMSAEHKGDLVSRYLYVAAAANMNRPDAVKQVVEEVLGEPDSPAAAEFLTKAYPFLRGVNAQVRKAVIRRIETHSTELTAGYFDLLLKCSHDLQERGWQAEAAKLEIALKLAATSGLRSEKLEIYNAQLHFWNGRYDLQLAGVNNVLNSHNLDLVGLIDESSPLSCENLETNSSLNKSVSGPLVSILMPAYNSSQTIAYAMESIRRQTYHDLELIVVNDGSNDDTAQIIADFSAVDTRFRVISLQRNEGTFVARNIALAAARGEFVTNQDADDWAHPEKIETAVTELQTDKSIIATWVQHVRCSSHKGFRALSGYIRPDASSLMFRRRPVMEKIGWYDSVRAAGDGEFHLRMERAFGSQSIRLLNKLLSFVNWSENSLSGDGVFRIDNDLGIYSPVRSSYRHAFGVWHETADPLYMPFPLDRRPFPVPDSILPSEGSEFRPKIRGLG